VGVRPRNVYTLPYKFINIFCGGFIKNICCVHDLAHNCVGTAAQARLNMGSRKSGAASTLLLPRLIRRDQQSYCLSMPKTLLNQGTPNPQNLMSAWSWPFDESGPVPQSLGQPQAGR